MQLRETLVPISCRDKTLSDLCFVCEGGRPWRWGLKVLACPVFPAFALQPMKHLPKVLLSSPPPVLNVQGVQAGKEGRGRASD